MDWFTIDKIVQQRFYISLYKILIKVNGCGQTDLKSECLGNCTFYQNKRQNNMKKCLFSNIAAITNMFRQF